MLLSAPEQIPVRDLRNHVSDLLRKVEQGARFEITVNHRPVAMLVPRAHRPRTLPKETFLAGLVQADPALENELAAEFAETTDELRDPWA